MASVYGEQTAQRIEDERWLRDVGARGWVVLMKDDAIRRRPGERDALVEAGVRAFCLTNAQLRAAEQTERFVSNRHRIIQRARKPGALHLRRLREGDPAALAHRLASPCDKRCSGDARAQRRWKPDGSLNRRDRTCRPSRPKPCIRGRCRDPIAC